MAFQTLGLGRIAARRAASTAVKAEAGLRKSERAALAPTHLEPARRSLAALAAHAEARDVTLGIESRLLFHEFPLPQELATLLADHDPAVVGYWHDVGHVEVHHRLGLTDRGTWFDLLGDRIVGVHLHDVRGRLSRGSAEFTEPTHASPRGRFGCGQSRLALRQGSFCH